METLKKVKLFIEANQLFTADSQIIVAVSGGIDSVVLLHILRKLNYNCIVAHCNFHLRGEESNRDEEFVANLAKKYELIYRKIDFDTVSYAKGHKISIEMAARELRYRWFDKISKELKADCVAVAHHADDSIETMLMNLVRGTGLKGLTGIEPQNGNIVRPLLTCTRTEIEKFAQQNDIDFVFDSTNAQNDYQRNKFRNEILPSLAQINPSVKQTLFETIARLRGTWKIYESCIRAIEQEITFSKENSLYIDIEKLKKQADSFSVLYEILQKYQFNNDTVEMIYSNLDDQSGSIYYSETHRLLKDRDFLIMSKRTDNDDTEIQLTDEIEKIQSPISLQLTKISKTKNFHPSKVPDTIHIDADKIKFPLTLRHWKTGDTFFPFGMEQQKKISDFFIDEKLNRFQKEETWLLLSENQVVWIVGIRLDNRFRITESTQNILEIKYLLQSKEAE